MADLNPVQMLTSEGKLHAAISEAATSRQAPEAAERSVNKDAHLDRMRRSPGHDGKTWPWVKSSNYMPTTN